MRRALSFAALLTFAAGCDSSAGCDGVLTDLEGPISPSAYFDAAAVARVSSSGVGFIETNLGRIVGSIAAADCSLLTCPSGWGTCDGEGLCQSDDPDVAFLAFKLPSTTFDADFPLFGSYPQRICMPAENPQFDDCTTYVRLDAINIDPNSATADLGLTADLTIWSSKILLYVDNPGPNVGTCDIYLRQAADSSLPVYKTITAEIDFDNGNPLGRLAVLPKNVNVSITQDDVFIDGCVLEYDFIKNFVFGFIEDTIQESVAELLNSTIEGLLSEGCEMTACSRTDLSYCDPDAVCRFNSDDTPVPVLLGLEGNLAIGALLGGFSGRADRLDFSAFANAGGTSNGGLTLELTAAAVAEQSDCVPPSTAATPTIPTFVPSGSGYHLAIGASDRLLNTVVHEAFSGGAICQTLGGGDIAALNSGAVSLIVPSLAELTDGTVPLTIDILPRQAPEVQIGANITEVDADGATVLVEPLITLVMNDLDLDIYAERQGALFRAMTLRVDLAVDLSLAEGPNGELQLVAGDSSRWLQNTTVLNAEVISESPQDIEDAIPVLLGVVLPLLTDSLDQSFPLPAFGGFTLDLLSISGSQTFGMTAYDKTRYAHLALYANLGFDTAAAQTVAKVDTRAVLVGVERPTIEAIRDGAMVIVRIDADFEQREPDAGVVLWSRVDEGFWRPLHQGTALVIKDPVLHLEGRHLIDVAAARAGVPGSRDATPVTLEVISDFQFPTLDLFSSAFNDHTFNGQAGIEILATDSMALPGELRVSYTVDGLPRGALALDDAGRATIPIDAAQHLVTVSVTDLVGHETVAQIGVAPMRRGQPNASPTVANPPESVRRDQAATTSVTASSSCAQSSGDPAAFGLLALFVFLGRRRSRIMFF